MTPELRSKFLEVDGYWIPRKEVDRIERNGVYLRDGRYILGEVTS